MVSSLLKLYEHVLFAILTADHFQTLHHAILGFRGGCRTAHVNDFTRIAAGRAEAWRYPLWVMTLDIRTAFDCMLAKQCVQELLRCGAP